MDELSKDYIIEKQLEIMKVVDEFCKEHNIAYFLAYGTLLGAIRHNGFIPWDDDFDIAMPRPDYERFMETFNLYNKQFHAISYERDNKFLYTFGKICDTESILYEKNSIKYPLGIYIDIFPVDGIKANDSTILKIQNKLRFLLDMKIVVYSSNRKFLKNIKLLICKYILFWLPTARLIKIMIRNAKSENYESSKEACILATGASFNKPVDKVYFEKTIRHKFEDYEFEIPVGYDEWLTSIYGNYMELPPIDERISPHNFIAFKKVVR